MNLPTALNNTPLNNPVSAASLVNPTPLTDSLRDNVVEELALLGEKLGSFKAYDSQLPIADIAGTRIVKCLYQKNTKSGTKAQDNAYVRLPTKHLTEEHIVSRVAELSPYILAWLQEQEDKAVKELHKKGGLQVFTEYLSLDKIIEVLEESLESSRLNKDKINAWFDDKLETTLVEAFSIKLGITQDSTENEVARLIALVNAYKAKFAQLSSPKVYLKEQDCEAMIRVIEMSEDAKSSLLGARFITKLANLNSKVEELLELL